MPEPVTARPPTTNQPVREEKRSQPRSRLELGRSAFALFDQALVSGASFVTTVLVGRYGGDEQLGLYSLGFTFLVLVIALQDSLITGPYTVLATRRPAHERPTYAGHVLLHHALLAVLSLLGFGMAALIVGSVRGWDGGLAWELVVLAGATPCVLLRELLRRLAFADLDFRGAVRLDGGVVLVQLAGLGTLAGLALLGAMSAFAVVGIACMAVGLGTLALTRRRFDIQFEGVWQELERNWSFGRWLVAGQLIGVVHGFVVYWLLGFFLGPAATGNFAACMTIVMLSNPLILGLGNSLGPRIARVAADEPEESVRSLVGRSNLVVGGVMTVFAVGVIVVGEPFLVALYGSEFAGNALTLDVLALAFLVGSLSTATDYGLRAAERADLSFYASSGGLVVTIVASCLLVRPLGIRGGAVSYLLGCVATNLLRFAFFRLIAFGPRVKGAT